MKSKWFCMMLNRISLQQQRQKQWIIEVSANGSAKMQMYWIESVTHNARGIPTYNDVNILIQWSLHWSASCASIKRCVIRTIEHHRSDHQSFWNYFLVYKWFWHHFKHSEFSKEISIADFIVTERELCFNVQKNGSEINRRKITLRINPWYAILNVEKQPDWN